mgnify:FL=1
MKKVPSIGEAEWQVMEVLWQMGRANFTEIRIALKSFDWTQTTIHTMLQRLQKKGLIDIEPDSSPYVYYPLVSKDACRKHETKTFLQKVYNGSLKLLISNFINEADLTEDDIDELMKILKNRKKEG